MSWNSDIKAAMLRTLEPSDRMDCEFENHGEIGVLFKNHRLETIVVIHIHIDGWFALIGQSCSLTTCNWEVTAEIMGRAARFVKTWGLKTTRP